HFSFTVSSITYAFTLSLHDALPICLFGKRSHYRPNLASRAGVGATWFLLRSFDLVNCPGRCTSAPSAGFRTPPVARPRAVRQMRSEEHTSELQSRGHLVCRLLLEKK